MTAKAGKRTTRTVRTAEPRTQKTSPTDLDSLPMKLQWERTGFCFSCLLPVEALQPGGLASRHIHSQVPNGKCPQGLKEERVESEDIG